MGTPSAQANGTDSTSVAISIPAFRVDEKRRRNGPRPTKTTVPTAVSCTPENKHRQIGPKADLDPGKTPTQL